MTETIESIDETLADALAPSDARYVLLCPDCRTAWPYERDSKTVKAARDGDAECECGATIKLVRDNKPE